MHQITKFKCSSPRLAFVFAQSIEARCQVENEDVDGAALTGDAPTTSEWSTILLPSMVRLILETWRYSFLPLDSPLLVKHIETKTNGCQFPDDIFRCIFFNENV